MDNILIVPQPEWQEEPSKDNDGNWCGRYQYMRLNYNGDGEPDVDVCIITPPSSEYVPVEIDGKWYWNRRTPESA